MTVERECVCGRLASRKPCPDTLEHGSYQGRRMIRETPLLYVESTDASTRYTIVAEITPGAPSFGKTTRIFYVEITRG